MCKSQRAVLLNELSPSTSVWIPGFELMSPGLRSKCLCSLSHLIDPFLVLMFSFLILSKLSAFVSFLFLVEMFQVCVCVILQLCFPECEVDKVIVE